MRVSDAPTALAALGAYRYLDGLATPSFAADPGLAARISQVVSRGAVTLSVDRELIDETRLPEQDIRALRDAWLVGAKTFADASAGHGVRVFIEPLEQALEPVALALLADAREVASVALVDRKLKGPATWSWPLRIGAVDDVVAQALAAYPDSQLITVDDTLRPSARYDLLIVTSADDIDKAAAIRVSAGLLLRFAAPIDTMQAEQLRTCNGRIPFRAGAIVSTRDDITACIHTFLDLLAQDTTPDEAIWKAIGTASDLVLMGDPAFFDRARVSAVTANLEAELEHQYDRGLLQHTLFERAMNELSGLTAPAWRLEGGAATESANKLASIRKALPTATRGDTVPKEGGRHLQAQVFEQSNTGYVVRTRSFKAGARHEIRVRIGPTGLDWISVPLPFPDKVIAVSESRLTVRMVLPAVLHQPVQQDILLGVTGASTVARFEIDVPIDLAQVQATVIVFHQGKHLQTGELTGPVSGSRPSSTDGGEGIVFSRGAASAAELTHQRMFDLTVVKDGSRILLEDYRSTDPAEGFSHAAREPSLQGIDKRVDAIREYLFDAACRADQLSAGLESAGLEMIQTLAEHGEFLRRRLFANNDMTHVKRVQIVSPSSSDFFPMEFLYDYVLPNEDAALCPHFKLHVGPGCSNQCPAKGGNPNYVCPSGFWALNRVIERQVRPTPTKDEDWAGCQQPESSASRPDLMPLANIVFSAADEVNEGNPRNVAQTVTHMQKFAPVYRAASWSAWQKQVADHYPALLVSLPHHIVTHRGFSALQIAADQTLTLNRIEATHVAPPSAKVGPMILLLGCNTANTEIAYEDFVYEFRCRGAALIVGTLTFVLGTHAAQLAREFVLQIWSAGDEMTIGEIMREVRRRMLVQDNPMALAITAFGDADWRFRLGG